MSVADPTAFRSQEVATAAATTSDGGKTAPQKSVGARRLASFNGAHAFASSPPADVDRLKAAVPNQPKVSRSPETRGMMLES